MTELSVDLLDPPAYSPAYDHELAAALGRAGARVRLLTSAFAFADVPSPSGYAREERFYRHAVGGAGSRLRALSKRAQHVPNLLSYKDPAAVVHWQWTRGLDLALGPERPTVVTVHDPHGAAGLGRADAIIVHTEHAREQLAGFDNVHVVPHGALALTPARPRFHSRPMVLCFGLIRPYKGIDTLLAAWRQVHGADLWIVGRQ
ncbi:MAG: glycosyltransferase, partial [Solirubrobacterales bacterium]|nr:glycosyltransferase [Solirubrobacterales bacterium]